MSKESEKIQKEFEEIKICDICGEEFSGWGNNPEPILSGTCCDKCNALYVIPVRIERLSTKPLPPYCLTNYLKWCVENKRYPGNIENLIEFKKSLGKE